MTDETEKPKVVTLGRQAYVPPPLANPAKNQDEKLIAMLASMVDRAILGQIETVAVLTTEKSTGLPMLFIHVPEHLPRAGEELKLTGVAMMLQQLLTDNLICGEDDESNDGEGK
jgi:hypothetical protein